MTTRDKHEWRDPAPGDDPDPQSADGPDPDQGDTEGVGEVIDVTEASAAASSDEPGDATNLADLPPPPGDADPPFDPDVLLSAIGADVAAERDEYRDALLRVKADFENYKKRVAKDHAATVERAAEKIVGELLPVLDACEAAIIHGSEDVEPIYKSLMDTLEKGGLVRLDCEGEPFDPNLHEAVMHEPSDDEDEHVVIESLRTGYTWNGRVVRPAMVKVRG